MATLTIDDKEYEIDDLSDEAKAQIMAIRFVDQELVRLGTKSAAMQTARNAYARALASEIGAGAKEEDPVLDLPDDLDFD